MLLSVSSSTVVQDSETDSTLPGESCNPVDDLDLPIALRKRKSLCLPSHLELRLVMFLSTAFRTFVLQMFTENTLSRVRDALEDQNWKMTMVEEMHALDKNNTWDIVDLLERKHAIGCKWAYG